MRSPIFSLDLFDNRKAKINSCLVQYKSRHSMQKSIVKLLLFLYNKEERSGVILIGLTHPTDKLSTASYCMHSSKQVEA